MKTKTLLSLLIAVIATLSFTLISVTNQERSNKKDTEQSTVVKSDTRPIGGFGSEDRL